MGQDRTVLCPSCGECFCRAPRDYQQRFWAAAPAELRAAHRRAVERVPVLVPNPVPSAAVRPLVLVVDDEPSIVRLVQDAIEEMGCGTIHATDGATGLALAREYHPALVVSDALMPGMDGREMCRQLKQDAGAPPVILMTGVYTSQRNVNDAHQLYRADGYLAKPFGVKPLQQAVRRFLGGAPSTDRRATQRFPCRVSLILDRVGTDLPGEASEITVMENVGPEGALVRTSLPVAVGELVAVRQPDGGFRAQAIVRQVSVADGTPRLHLLFRVVEGLDGVLPSSSR